MPQALRLGTRGSPLAVWQAEWVARRLAAHGVASELVRISTVGDRVTDLPLPSFGIPAVFSKELDEALFDRRIDLAVHSLKDLPSVLPEGIALAAVSEREDPRDALVGREGLRWETLPRNAVVATSSLRRRAQLLRARPDLRVVDLRGNVGTRVETLDRETGWSAIVLAVAGLLRLGLAERIGERLPVALFLPAPGQGALAVTVRADDAGNHETIRQAVNDPTTQVAVTAERAMLEQLEGGCQVPIGVYARVMEGRRIVVHGRVLSLDGQQMVEGIREADLGPDYDNEPLARELGVQLAEELVARGADRILDGVRNGPIQEGA